MTYKEMTASIMVASAVTISGWVAWEAAAGGLDASVAEAATRMLWAVGYVIAFNIVASIVMAILVSIVRGEEIRDEKADERDLAVSARAMRNGYFVLSIGVVATLALMAVGGDPVLGVYALFGVSMLAGSVFAGSQLVYYRLG